MGNDTAVGRLEHELERDHGIRTVETDQRVPGIPTDLATRFRMRADRRARNLNGQRVFPSYRWEVVREGGRWHVVAMQNVAQSS